MTKDTLTIQEKVIEIIGDKLSLAEDKIALDSHFTKDLGADSLETVELVMEFEDTFEIDISEEEALEIETVQDAIERIEKKISQ